MCLSSSRLPTRDPSSKPDRWYEKAAVQGQTDAQVNLESMYDYGRGVPQDFKMAVKWYRRSANQENDLSQRRLGLLYERGDCLPQDYVQTYIWYKLGAANGGKSGAVLRDELAIRMTSEQISTAQKLARAWKPNPMKATPCPSKRPPSRTCG